VAEEWAYNRQGVGTDSPPVIGQAAVPAVPAAAEQPKAVKENAARDMAL